MGSVPLPSFLIQQAIKKYVVRKEDTRKGIQPFLGYYTWKQP